MPNRMLRDWTASDKVDSISVHAERLLVRLIMKADDFGSYHANPKLISSFCFPLKDNIRETDISRWLQELDSAGLIAFYTAEGKRLLNIFDFGQRKRSMKKAFPLFDSNSPQLAAILRNSPPEGELEENIEIEEEGEVEAPAIFVFKGWDQYPKYPDSKFSLDENDFIRTEEFIHYTRGAQISREKINEQWAAFQVNTFTGKKFYQEKADCLQHFRNWLKDQKIYGNKYSTGTIKAPQTIEPDGAFGNI